MKTFLTLLGITGVLSTFVLGIMWKQGAIDMNFLNAEFSYYSITSIICNVIGLIIFIYSVKISNNYTNLPSSNYSNMLFYSYITLFYLSFILLLFYMWYKSDISFHKNYIIKNSIFIAALIPFIVLRNDLYFDESFYDVNKDDFINKKIGEGGSLDLREYNQRTGEDEEIRDPDKIKIRKTAVEAEYNERRAIEDGIYD